MEAAACGGCGAALTAVRTPAAERRQLTVFFADLVGSTALAESLDPEDLRELYSRYQALCAEAIQRYEGFIAQYLGDGILAYFGYPAAHEDDAARAVRAALEVLARASEIAVGGIRPPLRIGIHTGLVVVGDVGATGRREQLALGEAPNVAARLQAEASPDAIVVSDATRGLLGGQFALEELGSRTLKGISRPMQIYRVLGHSTASRFQAMKSAYGLVPFVGREREVKAIRAAWAEAAGGQGQCVLLRGEAGMGKSRLMDAARHTAAPQLHEIFEAQCSPYQINSPLYPIAEMIERRLGIEERMSAANKLDLLEQFSAGRGVDVAQATAALAGLLSVPVQGRYSESDLPPAKRLQMAVDLIADLLVHAVDGTPVLLLIEDLHWADPSTLDLLAEIAARVPNRPAMMICTTRPEFSPAWLCRPHCTDMQVRALTTQDARALVAHVAGRKRLPASVVEEIAKRTGGIPLFIEAVTRTVLSSGLLMDLEDRYELTGPLPSGLIPATVQDSLMARIDRLGPDKPVAQLAATIGRESGFELLQAVLGWPAAPLTAALQRMVELGLVLEDGAPPSASYTFSHSLIQDAAYESLLRKTRQEFHHKIAEALLQRFPEMAETKPELLARHHEGAGRMPEATTGWMKAGQQARNRLALRECEAHLRKAISLLQTLPEDDPTRLQSEMEAQLALGQALTETAGWASREVEAAFTRAGELCTKANNYVGLYQVLTALSGTHFLRGEQLQALEAATRVHEMAIAMADPVLVIAACHAASYPAYYMADFSLVRKYAEEALPLATPDRERVLMGLLHIPSSYATSHVLGMSLWCLGYPDQAERHWAWGRALIEDLNIEAAKTYELGFMLHAHHLRGDKNAIAATVEQAYTRALDAGYVFWSTQAHFFRGWAQAMSGDTQAGIAEMKAALESYLLTGTGLNLPYFWLMLAEAQLKAGELDEALSWISRGLERIAESAEHVKEPELLRLQGEIYLAQGDIAAAESGLRHAIQVAQCYDAKMFEARAVAPLARLLRDQQRVDEARALVEPLEAWFQEGRNTAEVCELRNLLEILDAAHANAAEPGAPAGAERV
jgi:class 3 adenylate cyclase